MGRRELKLCQGPIQVKSEVQLASRRVGFSKKDIVEFLIFEEKRREESLNFLRKTGKEFVKFET